MNIDEFLQKANEEKEDEQIDATAEVEEEEELSESLEENIDVQKAVVESLAADKAELDACLAEKQSEIAALKEELARVNGDVISLRDKIAESKSALEKVGDVLLMNKDTQESNKIALLDRSEELQDRFEGETRDHVLEVLKEARDRAEQEGRLRRAQILESVLVANESSGNLQKKRAELEKLFRENQNVISGSVINELDNKGITYKVGEKYLLVGEIIKRSY